MKQKHAISFLLLLCCTAILVSCGNKSGKSKDTPADTSNRITDEPGKIVPAEPTLACKDLGIDSNDIPHFNLMLLADGKETMIKTINNCNDIPRSEYKRYEIPDDAIIARGGWFAGAGDYYYIVKRNGKLSVFEGWEDEMQEDNGYHWKEVILK